MTKYRIRCLFQLLLLLALSVMVSCSVANQDIQQNSDNILEESSEANSSDTTSDTETTDSHIDKKLSWITQLGADSSYFEFEGEGEDRSDNDECSSVATDEEGNVYCAGETSASLGSGSAGETDAFIMKLGPDGEVLWITQLGEGGQESCYGVAVDSIGNVYCAGAASSDFGEPNAGEVDAFVLKLDSEGDLQWITQLGQDSSYLEPEIEDRSEIEYCYAISIDSQDNVYCAGYTEGSLGEANAGLSDAFIMKLDSGGDILWITQLGASTGDGDKAADEDYCYAVTTDTEDNVYCSGYTFGSLGEDSGGESDIFIMKLNSEGELQWLTQLGDETGGQGSSLFETCFSIAVDSKNNVYCGGVSIGELGWGAMGSDDNDDAFIMKLNSNGSLLWTRQFGDNFDYGDDEDDLSHTYCYGIAVDSKDNVYCAGSSDGSLWEKNAGGSDAFILKLNSDGWPLQLIQLGEETKAYSNADHSKGDYCRAVTIDLEDNLYCSGYTYGSLGETNGGSETTDAFVMKLE